tara:strand:- start:304 stop:495 length:192 start_codon:yes stop_codon:yes gene_type:complete
MNIPPHFIDEKNKDVVFHIPGGFPATMGIPTWMKSLSVPSDYSASVVRCEETFYKLRGKVNEL